MFLVVIVAALILAHGLRREAGYLQLPALTALLALVWFSPQLAQLWRDPSVPESGQSRLAAMMVLCLLAIWLGWHVGSNRTVYVPPSAPPALLTAAFAVTLISIAINLLLESYRAHMAGVQQWSGPITIIAFFAQIRDIALPISLLLFLTHRSKYTLLILILNLSITLPIAFTLLRRSETIGLGAAILCGLWFARRQKLPMIVLITGVLGLSIVVYAIGPLRSAALASEIATGNRPSLFNPYIWMKIDIADTIERNARLAHDLRNALYVIDLHAENYSFQLGAVTWNGFIKQYIPSQFLGSEFKNSLYIGPRNNFEDIFIQYDFNYSEGTTSTGFGSAFSDFGYLGSLYFFFISMYLRYVFDRAKAGWIWSQVAYMCFLPLTLVSLTHGHDKFLVSAPFLLAMIWMLRTMAKRRIVLTGRHYAPSHASQGR